MSAPSAKRARVDGPTPTPCLHHHVLFKFKASVSTEAIAAATVAADALSGVVPGVLSSKLTPISVGSKTKGFTHQYLVVLGDEDALAVYDAHPAHKALGINHLAPMVEDELVYDIPSTLFGKLSGKVALITGSSSGSVTGGIRTHAIILLHACAFPHLRHIESPANDSSFV